MSEQETQVVEQTEEDKAKIELAKNVAQRTIELRNAAGNQAKAMMAAAKIAQDVCKEFDITMSDFSLLYDKGVRENYDEMSTLSLMPLSVIFKVFAKNKHGEEKQVGYVKGNSYENAIDVLFKEAKPFFFDKEDCRAEVVVNLDELKKD